ncbi:MAG TPA: alpha/beta hydrolase, partial [Parafilimonas sp.]|nr:alpha/beta hydrolase [Parafilimonas sp.]
MQTIYCLSGLGANEKVFQFLDLSFAKPVFIQWLPPRQNETLRQYALRLKEEFITEPEPVIFGLSLGGMMAVEIAKVIPSATAILISSAKTRKEIPFYLRMLLSTPVYKMVPEKVVRRSKKIQSYFLGA